ncbi:hypothetical protein DPMN_004426 [Dreissena polymorpha]|uniref:Uncharacterized protein n=1 Tax=Dreissena polymorpha TaxID=45954 RepID=A0A9D4MQS9_DREPO|nr:hypothetical protein DPMN_004426 [Dreissena polymorpha]
MQLSLESHVSALPQDHGTAHNYSIVSVTNQRDQYKMAAAEGGASHGAVVGSERFSSNRQLL